MVYGKYGMENKPILITIYGKPNCDWCDRAKKLCEDYRFDYEYKDVSYVEHKEELKLLVPDVKTVPQIFKGKKYIGGFSEFASEMENTIGGYGENAI
jgi:glutaredoxin 1